MSGICMSRMPTWYGSPASRASASARSADGPSLTSPDRTPHALSWTVSTSRFVALSSTTSTWLPRISAVGSAATGAASSFGNRSLNENSEPRPSALTRPISPPISSTSRFEMASPSPVPP